MGGGDKFSLLLYLIRWSFRNMFLYFLSWKQTVDASKSIEDLHREIKSIAEETMQQVQNRPLGELWK